MKARLFILGLLLTISSATLQAQRQIRIGFVDMDYVLENIPEYKQANTMLNNKIQEWQAEIQLKQQKIDDLKEELNNERPLLTAELIQERQDEIDYLQKKLLEYQQKRFGPQGDLVARKRQIIKPIEDQVFNAIQQIGDEREYDFIFENSASALLLYSANRHDISDQVLALITRNSRRSSREETQKRTEISKETTPQAGEEKEEELAEEKLGEPVYKSVSQAKKDREAKEKREAELEQRRNEREAKAQAIKHRRDSIRSSRRQAYEAEQAELMKNRQARRDSIEQAREQMRKDRMRRRDSLMKARQHHRDSVIKARQNQQNR